MRLLRFLFKIIYFVVFCKICILEKPGPGINVVRIQRFPAPENCSPHSQPTVSDTFNIVAGAGVRSDTAGAAYHCYGSLLDNNTCDPTTLYPMVE